MYRTWRYTKIVNHLLPRWNQFIKVLTKYNSKHTLYKSTPKPLTLYSTTMSPRKRAKVDTIAGCHIRFNERDNCYRHKEYFINFGIGDSRVYDVSEAFLTKDILFEILSEVRKVITVGNPKSRSGNLSGKGIELAWVLNRFDRKFIKRCDEYTMTNLLKRLGGKCDSECLRGITYRNKFQDPVDIHMDGPALHEICTIMGYEPRPLYIRGANLLNLRYKGHRSNGDSVIKVSTISEEDLPVYMVFVREKIMRAQKLDGQEYLITSRVDDAEETLVRSLHELSRRFDVPDVVVNNEPNDTEEGLNTEVLIEEQLEACSISMNNPVSYLCGLPGTGKTSTLCKIMKDSHGVVVLTPSHVSKEVVYQRGIQNGVDPQNFSVEVTSFAVRHTDEWMPDHIPEGDQQIGQRSIDFMEKFKKPDGSIQIETLVIEEASMVDIFQASKVINQFCDIPSLKRIVFCGDMRQLPSVAKGRVLQDIMECGTIPGKILETNHRSGEALSSNLRHILNSSMIHIEEDDTFEVVSVPIDHCEVDTDKYGRDRVVALQPIIDLYMDHVDKGFPCHIFGYTHIEINQINNALKTSIFGSDSVTFPNGCKVRIKDPDAISNSPYHRNDFIEIVENKGLKNYTVRRWSNNVRDEDSVPEEPIQIKINGRLSEALGLGFASSIHAFQGSECPYVIVHGVPNCAYFCRDSMYTAMSRGKKKCTIVTCNKPRFNWKKIVYKRAIVRLSNLSRRF